MLDNWRYYLPAKAAKEDLKVQAVFLLVLALFILGPLSLWAAAELKEYLAYPTLAGLERKLAAQLKSDTDKEQVLGFLDHHQIGHGDYHRVRENEKSFSLEFTDFGRGKLQGKLERIQHRIYSGTTISAWDSFTECWATVWFYFDENDKLVEYVISGACDGL